MCGINGFTRRDEALIRRMNSCTKHRGPDGDGVFVCDDVSLGHLRLAIIDPNERSNQPMFDREHSIALVFNGEIYNFHDLRRQLEDHYDFVTSSDTEVIIAGYRHWGSAVFSKLNGIFALALFDIRSKELYLARDQRGVKPFYYYHNGSELFFSSEVKALLAAGVPAELDHTVFQYYMRLRYAPLDETLFVGIKKVNPGELITFRNGELQKTRLKYEPQFFSLQPLPGVRETIAAAVERQVVSDKPVGVFLSGGMDSTIVTYEAIKHINNLQAYSTWFDLDHQTYSDEYNQDAMVAKHTAAVFGIDHHLVYIKPEDVVSHFEKLVWHNDVPVPSLTMLSQYKIAERAKRDVDVALGGDGGDEYFGGYHRYRYSYFMEQYQRLPQLVRQLAGKIVPQTRKLNLSDPLAILEQFNLEKGKEIAPTVKVYRPEVLTHFLEQYIADSPQSYHDLLIEFDRQFWLPNFSLVRTDKMGMAHGLEVRVPMLDLEIEAVAKRIPNWQKFDVFHSKKILRQAYRDVLPQNVLKAPKSGWISPGSKWLRNPQVREFMLNILSPSYYPETAQLFDWNMVEKYYTEHCEGGVYHYNILLSIATFQVWARKFNVKV